MNVVEIVFSPTGGTEKVAHIIGKQWSENPAIIDLTDAKADFSKCKITEQDMVLIAMPSFGGRAPAVAIERLKQIAGNGAKCTLVCVYGNRAYEDTLVEMEDAAKECGFQAVAAIAAVAEHSIMPQYAASRPDASDQKQLTDYAKQIADKAGIVSAIPGNRPYKKAGGAGLVPKPDKACVKCGACAETCPVQAIDPVSFTADAKPFWLLGFPHRYLFRCALLARSTEKDITGFFEKSACDKAFRTFFAFFLAPCNGL